MLQGDHSLQELHAPFTARGTGRGGSGKSKIRDIHCRSLREMRLIGNKENDNNNDRDKSQS